MKNGKKTTALPFEVIHAFLELLGGVHCGQHLQVQSKNMHVQVAFTIRALEIDSRYEV